jgi:hypothetical protein
MSYGTHTNEGLVYHLANTAGGNPFCRARNALFCATPADAAASKLRICKRCAKRQAVKVERQREVGKQALTAMAAQLDTEQLGKVISQLDRENVDGATPGASQVLADEFEEDQPKAPTTEQLVEAVKQHAMNNYNGREGWDFIVECWSDQDIIECIGDAATAKQAIARVRRSSTALADQRSDICNA